MSGPKTSVLSPNFISYSGLSAAQKEEWVNREILFTLRNIAQSQKKLEAMLARVEALQDPERPDVYIQELAGHVRAFQASILENAGGGGPSQAALNKAKRAGAIDVGYYSRPSLSKTELTGKYRDFYESLSDKNLEEKTQIARELAVRSVEMKKELRRLELACWDVEQSLKEEVFQDGVRTSFFLPFRALEDREGAEKIIGKINASLSAAAELILSDSLLDKLAALKKKASGITDASCLDDFYQLVVRPFVSECEQYDRFYQEHYAEYEKLRTEVEILAEQLHLLPQEKEFSAESLEYYRAEKARLEKLRLDGLSQAFLREAVDEAMREMGYPLVGERDLTRKNGKKYHNGLYQYKDGTAISVMQCSDGQLTMEIGGLDLMDRLPSEAEAGQMVGEMHSFCEAYEKIEQALAEKGVESRRVSLCPPDAQYAQIINMKDYRMVKPTRTISEAAAARFDLGDLKKTMQRED